jgi:hypothetical protein
MIKLIDLVKEISFGSGQASSNNAEDISSDAIYMNGIEYELGKKRKDDYDELQIPVSDPVFQNQVKKKFVTVGESSGYRLLTTKSDRYGGGRYYLINPNAKVIGEYFIGIIKTEVNTGEFYNLKKAFGVEVETVHWSNVALEMRGTGVGKLMYTMVYDHVKSKGRALGSDSMLFEGSAGMWMRYMPSIAKYFGIIVNDLMLPIAPEELNKKNKSAFELFGVDGFVAMETPATLVRKIAYNVKGLSFVKGEYGVVRMDGKVNDIIDVTKRNRDIFGQRSRDPKEESARFIDYVNNFSTMKALLNSPIDYSIRDITGTKKTKYKTILFAFEDAVLIVKELPNGLSVTPL